ncbi:hypothetical protein F5884DRAFT_56658 [Xylogone sp. PMI_703]|nr:hypothetical protein F5884DRAFT_56658 [Xylogone sp. PMI_703]
MSFSSISACLISACLILVCLTLGSGNLPASLRPTPPTSRDILSTSKKCKTQYQCYYPGYSVTCSRLSDLECHKRRHDTLSGYTCNARGCTYRSYRMDKLRNHSLKTHGVVIKREQHRG